MATQFTLTDYVEQALANAVSNKPEEHPNANSQ